MLPNWKRKEQLFKSSTFLPFIKIVIPGVVGKTNQKTERTRIMVSCEWSQILQKWHMKVLGCNVVCDIRLGKGKGRGVLFSQLCI